jgi:hypothetical protein
VAAAFFRQRIPQVSAQLREKINSLEILTDLVGRKLLSP